ncbi:MAG: phenylalanine--tRNA ligase subunit beta [Candidatus Fervidibacterota bacterium]
MRVSLSWLKEFMPVELSADEIAHTLEMAGLGIEAVEEWDGDVIFDLEITPNRGDWLSVYGVARELSAMLNLPLKPLSITVSETETPITDLTKVRMDAPDLCPRYSARLVLDVTVGESPDWLKRRLKACGIRPINNIVDITNYVLLELGQPLHAFDFDTLRGRQIIVRRARDGEVLYTLDEVRRELDSSMLVIADAERPVALAGIVGGLETAISPLTKNVLIESAHFTPSGIRRTARKLGIRTESSYRFERWVDPSGTVRAADRAAQLMAELAGGKVCQGVIDVYPLRIAPAQVSVRTERVRRLLGIDLSIEEVMALLRRLQMEVTVDGDTVHCLVPTFRNDIRFEADLIEEIARLYGYDRIPMTLPKGVFLRAGESERRKLENAVRQFLARLGLREVVTLSLTHPNAEARWGINAGANERRLKLRNPLTQDHTIVRTTLLPSLLSVIAHNFRNGVRDLWIFELGKVYRRGTIGDMSSTEPRRLGIVLTGSCYPVRWNLPPETGQADFFALKGIVERLLTWLGITQVAFGHGEHPTFHPFRTAVVTVGGEAAGVLGEVHPRWLKEHDLPQPVYAAELDFEKLAAHAKLLRTFQPLPSYPATQRDIAVVVPEDFEVAKVLELVKRVGGEWVEQVTVFDEYRGAPVPHGFRSVGVTLTLRAKDRTLSSEEADKLVQRIKDAIRTELGLTTRG